MKKCMMMTLVAMMASVVMAQASSKISLADARSRIDKVIASADAMKETMKQLSAEDQKAFLADVNKAISLLPASGDEKAAKFLAINTAALASAEKGNSATLFAEVFATVPVDALTVISERFAVDLLSRTADPNATISDAQYEKIALDTMEKVVARCEEVDNSSVRSTLAILTFIRASGVESEMLTDHLIDTLKHEDAKELARSEWVPNALNKENPNYEALLASADAGQRPDFAAVLVIAGPLYGAAVLSDLSGKSTEPDRFSHVRTPILDAVVNVYEQQNVRIGNDKPGGMGVTSGAVHGGVIEAGQLGGKDLEDKRPTPQNPDPKGSGESPIPGKEDPGDKPLPYPYQTF